MDAQSVVAVVDDFPIECGGGPKGFGFHGKRPVMAWVERRDADTTFQTNAGQVNRRLNRDFAEAKKKNPRVAALGSARPFNTSGQLRQHPRQDLPHRLHDGGAPAFEIGGRIM
jgi:hypothetical protein